MKKLIAGFLCLFIVSGMISPSIPVFGANTGDEQMAYGSEERVINTIFQDESQNLILNLEYSNNADNSLFEVQIISDPLLEVFEINNINYGILNDRYTIISSDFQIHDFVRFGEESNGSIPMNINDPEFEPGNYKASFRFYDDAGILVGTEDMIINIYDDYAPHLTTNTNEIIIDKGSVISEEDLVNKFGIAINDNRLGELSTSNVLDYYDIQNGGIFDLPGVHELVVPSSKWTEQFHLEYPYEKTIEKQTLKIIVEEIGLVESEEDSSDSVITEDDIEKPTIKYRSHIQNIGWQNYVEEGQTSGTTELGLRMEALEVEITNNSDLGVSYSTLVQNQGWNDKTSDGVPNGTVGLSKAIEALQLELTGNDKDLYDIYYRTYISEFGWVDWAKNGEFAGSEGYGYQIEAIEIKVVPADEIFQYPTGNPFRKFEAINEISYRMSDIKTGWSELMNTSQSISSNVAQGIEALAFAIHSDFDLGIKYASHVENIGWQDYIENGEVTGTVGKKQRLEALKLELTGSDKGEFDVFYRVYIDGIGWLDWAKNGNPAGTEGFGYSIVNLELKIAYKDSLDLETTKPFLSNVSSYLINYKSHVQNIGWQVYSMDGYTSGTEDENKRLEAMIINLNGSLPSGSVHYSTHIQDIGWTSEVRDGGISGTIGKAKRVEAIKIRLSGTISEIYDIYYRVKIKDFDWLGWAKNGEASGSEGYSLQLEAIEIRLLPRNEDGLSNDLEAFINKSDRPMIFHRSAIDGNSLSNFIYDSALSGTIGKSLGLTNIGLTILGNTEGTLNYSVYKSNYGWVSDTNSQELHFYDKNPIEALKVEIGGKLANEFDVVYRVHIQNYGWLDWTKNGHGTGSMDMGLRMEAFEIMLVPKSQSQVNLNDSSMKTKSTVNDYVARSHVQSLGWKNENQTNDYAGTVGRGLRLEALDLSIAPHLPSGKISIEAFVHGVGWVGENHSSFVGTVGEGRRIEEFKIRLSGLAAEEYDIYYRVHVSSIGWLGWAKNGEKAGSALFQNQIEAIDIDLVKKGDYPPVSFTEAFKINMPSNLKTLYMDRNDCFNLDRKIVPKGIVLHSTATPGVMAWEWYSRWNKSFNAGETNRQVAVHSFVDGNEIWQYLPWDHRGWHAGGSANNTHIGIEICEPGGFIYSGNRMVGYDVVANTAYFNNAWKNAIDLSVLLSRLYDFDETDIISHAEGYIIGVASNHSDVSHWFPLHGRNMDMFRKEVRYYLNL